jgi:chorismate mutase/prephenate dehydratase
MTGITPLVELRKRIDAIDQNILELINRRAALAMLVAQNKIAAGESGSFYRPDREALVMRRIKGMNPGPLSDETAMRFFRELMSACLALEKPLQVAFLGPEGTFTQQAAFKHFGHAAQVAPEVSIDEIFRAVENGHCHFGVVPVENSTEGVIGNTLDRFVISPLQICGEVEIRIHHNLMGNVGQLSEITEIFSHQQSLAQCRRWLDTALPGVKRTAVSSNAEAAKLAANTPNAAAIAGEVAAELYGLALLEKHIEDEPDNTTRFLVIGRQAAGSTGMDKTALMISTGNQPGALHQILAPFAQHGIGMTRIESRPSRRGLWDYVFFIDIEGHQDDPEVAQALAELKNSVKLLKILGSFPKAVL